MLLTVGQLAKLTGLTVRALHHYDARGLLTPSQRSEAGYRLYSQVDVLRLYRIQALQRLGLSLAEIATALDRDGSAMHELILQQLTELDEQIARSTLVRDQLRQLEQRLATNNGPTMAEWLRALELLATYDRHCSVEELQRLVEHDNDSDWPPFIRDLRDAMNRKLDPDSAAARALARRWVRLAMSRFGDDPELAKKLKRAYLDDATVQARVQAQSGFDMHMMKFCLEITTRAHLSYWARYLQPNEVARLDASGEWARDWGAVARQLKQLRTHDETIDIDTVLSRWSTVVLAFAGGDASLQSKVEAALYADADLRELWGIDAETLGALRYVKEISA